ncbi:hypothetical protein WDU94_008925 [Cyamophila willieti]
MNICYYARIKHWKPNFLQNLKCHLEFLKQKIASLGFRIRKYNKRVKRYRQNKSFYRNQKTFYRELGKKKLMNNASPPSSDSLFNFWSNIWGEQRNHNQNAEWIKQEEERMCDIPTMNEISITYNDIQKATKYLSNWKSPGMDNIQNYWIKYLTNCHNVLAKQFQECVQDPKKMPSFLTEGITYMIPKSEKIDDPAMYRPITCLPTMYKVFTSIMKMKIYDHISRNNIMSEEQIGSRSSTFGTKESLTIDTIVCKQAKEKCRNVCVAWIDYMKAYDSVPHSWLIKILEIYKVDKTIISFLQHNMKHWYTELLLMIPSNEIRTNKINLKRGIYQGDSLSSLWFCLALNPISHILNSHHYGYKINKQQDSRISHQFYMDDLKLYATNEDHLQSQLELVSKVSKDICMNLGFNKCKTLTIKHGKYVDSKNITLMNNIQFDSLEADETYKYLGMDQTLNMKESDLKQKFKDAFHKRVQIVMKTELYAKNKIQAINAWAIPLLTYTFGIINWSMTDLENLNRIVRTTMTKFRSHHPHSALERMYLPRSQGGRGLLDLKVLHAKQIKKMKTYFEKKTNNKFLEHAKKIDKYTPLKLSTTDLNVPPTNNNAELLEKWKNGALKGKYQKSLHEDEHVDKQLSTSYLTRGYLFSETEGFIHAIQDQTMKTRNYMKHIMKVQVNEMCRLCGKITESIQHLSSGCSMLAASEYLTRHDLVAKIIHQALKQLSFRNDRKIPYYKYKPEPILENRNVKIYWNQPIITDTHIPHNKPDILVINKKNKEAYMIDVSIPLDENLHKAYMEKKKKYEDLKSKLIRMYNLNKVKIIPIIISSNGLVHKDDNSGLRECGLENTKKMLELAQKSVLLSTSSIIRKCLNIQ